VIMSIITKPFKYAAFRITLFSIVGAAIGLLALDWYARRPVGMLPPGAMSHTVNYPEIDGDSDFRPMMAIRYAMPAITEFPIVAAEEADDTLHESELALGVTVGEQSRAYPINTLTGPEREIINDTLGGRAIAATW